MARVALTRAKGLGYIWAGVNQIYPPARGTSARQGTNMVTDPSENIVTSQAHYVGDRADSLAKLWL